MNLWQQVDWQYELKKKSRGAFGRMFRVKLKKLNTLEGIAPALHASQNAISFDAERIVSGSIYDLVNHLVETYGLGIVLTNGEIQDLSGERTWPLPDDPKQGVRTMAVLRQAEPRLEPRPFVKNGSSDVSSWMVLSSLDWAELEAADAYAVRALFPVGGKLPERPKKARGDATRRQRDPDHAELLAWVTENKDEFVPQLVEALEKLETSHPESTEERDAKSQIYRIGRRARR